MNSEHKKLSELMNDSHNEGGRDWIPWLFIGPFYAIWLMVGLAIISIIVAQLFGVGFLIAVLIVSGTTTIVVGVILLTKYLRRNRARGTSSDGDIKVPVVAVLSVMVMLLVIDYVLLSFLTYLKLNVILAHFLIMGSGIVLSGATSLFSQRAPNFMIAIAGGLFTSFLVIALAFGQFVGPNGQPAPVRQALLILLFGALLFGVSYAIVSQAAKST